MMSFIKAKEYFYRHLVVDVSCAWDGHPFASAGMNPLALYVGQRLVDLRFPPRPRSSWTHFQVALANLWYTSLWLLLAIGMRRRRIFVTF